MASKGQNEVSEGVCKHKLLGVLCRCGYREPSAAVTHWLKSGAFDTNTQEFVSKPQKLSSRNAPWGHCATFVPLCCRCGQH